MTNLGLRDLKQLLMVIGKAAAEPGWSQVSDCRAGIYNQCAILSSEGLTHSAVGPCLCRRRELLSYSNHSNMDMGKIWLCCCGLFLWKGVFPNQKQSLCELENSEPAQKAHFSPGGASTLWCPIVSGLHFCDPTPVVWGMRPSASGDCRFTAAQPSLGWSPTCSPVAAQGTSTCSKHDLCLLPPTWHWHVTADL